MNLSSIVEQVLYGKWFISFNAVKAAFIALELVMDNIQLSSIKLYDNKDRKPLPVLVATDARRASMGNSTYDDIPKDSTAIIPLKGVMFKDSTYYTYGTEEISHEMVKAGEHKNVSSIVLNTHSGGGSVDSVAPMLDAIDYVQNTLNKPVIGSVDMGCSAAYWTLSKSKLIIANNNISSEVGSIGVLMSFLDAMPFYTEKLKMKYHEIYGEKSEEFKNKSFRLALEGNYDKIIQEELNPLERNFQEAIKQNRGSKLDLNEEGIIYGKTFFADQALKNGLIDAIGNLDYAIKVAREMKLQDELRKVNF